MKIRRVSVDSSGNGYSVVLRSGSPERTFQIGAGIGKILKAGDFVALTGELGSGKTAFVQGLACGMGVPDAYAVVSPTFTLINEYPGQSATLYHLDVYRLAGSADLYDTGFEEAVFQRGVTVVEWAEKIVDFIPPSAITVTFEYIGETTREMTISVQLESMRMRLKGVVF